MATREIRQRGLSVPAQYRFSKVPRITIFFWIIKILTTAMGEAFADFMALNYSPVLAGVVGTGLFVVALVLQFRAKRYNAWTYWFAVSMVAVFGTLAADGMHIKLGISYAVSSAFFAVCLVVVFAAWYLTERTLSIHSICTRRRELFYWATVVATFALGTAVGDLTATTLGLGYLASGIVFSVAILIPGLAYWKFRLNAVVAFWTAYVLTRPLGASYADWMGVAHRYGGLALGRGHVALYLTIVIVALVGYLAVTRIDVDSTEFAAAEPARAQARHRR
ncbi:MAG TPA: hypothetical protein VMH35_17190 [Streptosporangiaceae bacterium]|nr:hypothetical protein [Streptosporangiaceae bacterium]